jgi:hypothetical protein
VPEQIILGFTEIKGFKRGMAKDNTFVHQCQSVEAAVGLTISTRPPKTNSDPRKRNDGVKFNGKR